MPDARETLNVGVIGGGFMAAVHSRAARTAGARLLSIASSTSARSARAASSLGFDAYAQDAEALIGDPRIDVVHICTPNATHERLATMALAAGKHVVCEKPLAVSPVSAERMTRAAAASNRVDTVPFVYRYHPMVREAKARVHNGDLGRLLHASGSYLQDWLLGADDTNWRVNSEDGGGSRAFGDIGSHLVDLIEFISGDRISALCAMTSIAYETRGGARVDTEDMAHLLIRLTSGAVGSLVVSQVAGGHKNDLSIDLFGSEASLAFEQERPDLLVMGGPNGTMRLTRDSRRLAPDAARLSLVPDGHPMGYQDAFDSFVRDTYAAVLGTVPHGLPRFADGARAAVVTESVVRSAQSGKWVDVPHDATREVAA